MLREYLPALRPRWQHSPCPCCRRLFKEACRLHKALAPSAAVHKARDVNELQRLAIAVESLASQVEIVILQDESLPWTADLDMFRLIRDSGVLVRAGELRAVP